MTGEHDEARKAALREMLAMPGWAVAREALKKELDACDRMLISGSYETYPDDLLIANRTQARREFIARLLEKPEEVLSGQSEAKPSQPMRLGAGRNIR